MVDDETIVRVAKASRINIEKIEEKEFASLRNDFNEILKIFEIIDDADVSEYDEEPTSLQVIDLDKDFRDDSSEDKNLRDESLKISPHKKDNFFKGPRCFD